jgi:conjugative transfer region protein TrbK
MSAAAKIAGVAGIAGLMVAVAITAAMQDHPARPAAFPTVSRAPDPLADELARCRTITMPDPGCERVWEANRRRFLGLDTMPATSPARPEEAMNDTGVIDNFLSVFTSYIDSGFGLVGGEVGFSRPR